MTGRFPGADNLEAFWQLICKGEEALTLFSEADLEQLGIEPAIFNDEHYVKAGQMVTDAEGFDAPFFGLTPREAEIIDPQQRLFLEYAWAAFEDAGYDPVRYPGQVGVYAGATSSQYLFHVYSHQEVIQAMGYFQLSLATEKDHLPTRVSYKLNLKGPSVNVQTACSTSLVAVHLACESLLNRQCDMALAGAVTLRMPQGAGYQYEVGGVAAPDGHCRPFDAQASGTVFGNGIGVVVLKRLEEALQDHDHIYAVLKSSAINNDGALKMGYTMPSVEGQAAVIAEAQALGDIAPETIGYIEAHGTGTALGDPIELEALTRVFRAGTASKGFCALGSVKANIGHLESAAGMAGLIKTVLALQHKELPPQTNFVVPNPRINFADSPFYVNTTLRAWPSQATPRRAGVSSFGMGGTNAHVILEEAQPMPAAAPSRAYQLLLLSAQSPAALSVASANLASHLQSHPEENLADIAFTLQVGRHPFAHRQMLVCADREEGLANLLQPASEHVLSGTVQDETRFLAWLFPGQGTQYVSMARDLYTTEKVFSGLIDYGARFLLPHLKLDLRTLLYPIEGMEGEVEHQLNQTAFTQPALFLVEYALARLWLSWGLKPRALLGHSVGEYVAACLAGVLSLEDALALVAARGQLVQRLPAGAMLSLPYSVEEVTPYLGPQISLAAVNSPTLTVVAGPLEAIADLEHLLQAQGREYRRLHTSHAFHSAMLDPILAEFKAYLSRLRFHAPKIPYISNVTGTWITVEEVSSPDYWVRQLRQTVRFAEGIETLHAANTSIFLEVGPGRTLSTLVRSHGEKARELAAIPSLHSAKEKLSDVQTCLTALGKLWLQGVEPDWTAFSGQEERRRVSLPTYPFEHRPYYLPFIPFTGSVPALSTERNSSSKPVSGEHFQVIFADQNGPGAQISEQLTLLGQAVVVVEPGEAFVRLQDKRYALNPEAPDDYYMLSQAIRSNHGQPASVLYLWKDVPQTSAALAAFGQIIASLTGEADPADEATLQLSSRRDSSVAYIAPGSPIEEKLVAIWEQLLGVEQPGVRDNFFDLGGHSLLASRMVARIREVCQVDVAVSTILESPTIAELAAILARKQGEQQVVLLPKIERTEHRGFVPASFAQRRLWFFEQLGTSQAAYTIPVAMRITGHLCADVLEQSFDELIRRHEILRTTFALRERQVVQVIAQEMHLDIVRINRSSGLEQAVDEWIRAQISAEVSRPFDLQTGPLMRATLLAIEPEEHILVIAMHHSISDAWSLGILCSELVTLYEALSQGKPSPLEALPFQYADVAIWQQRLLDHPTMQQTLAYWASALQDSQPYLALPFDRPRPQLQTFRGSLQPFAVPEQVRTQLSAFCRQEGKTLFVCLLAVFSTLLFFYSKQEDFNVGTAVANRIHVDMEKLIGFFVDTVVLRVRLADNLTFREMVEHVDQVVKGAQEHQGVPFEYLVDTLKVERDPAWNPLFQVAFVLQNTPLPTFHLESLAMEPLSFDIDTGSARFDLLLDMGETETGLVGFFEYNTDLFDLATIQQMVELFQLLLTMVLEKPEAHLLDFVDRLAVYIAEQQSAKKNEARLSRSEQLKQARRQIWRLEEEDNRPARSSDL